MARSTQLSPDASRHPDGPQSASEVRRAARGTTRGAALPRGCARRAAGATGLARGWRRTSMAPWSGRSLACRANVAASFSCRPVLEPLVCRVPPVHGPPVAPRHAGTPVSCAPARRSVCYGPPSGRQAPVSPLAGDAHQRKRTCRATAYAPRLVDKQCDKRQGGTQRRGLPLDSAALGGSAPRAAGRLHARGWR